jgi:nucleotide-binding universal stress UspA family protein
MPPIFKNILVPVDFSMNTELAIRKGIEMGGEENALLHLFHAERSLTTTEAEVELNLIKSAVEERWPSVEVKVHVGGGSSIPVAIIGISHLIGPELIVIGKHGNGKHFPFFNTISPHYLAKATNVSVLTVRPGCMAEKIKTIVIPVRDVVPERKLEIAVMIAQKNRARVHLVTTRKAVSSRAFVNTYRQLREVLGHQIEYHADGKRDLARATFFYAESITADLILADPGTESTNFSWTGRVHISQLLKQDSKVQVLDVM